MKKITEILDGKNILPIMAFLGFLSLTILNFMDGNFALSSLFLLFSIYYLRRLFFINKSLKKTPDKENIASNYITKELLKEDIKSELITMLEYYRKAMKGWKIIAISGWIASLMLLFFFYSSFIIIIFALTFYATYAFFKCKKAVNLISTETKN